MKMKGICRRRNSLLSSRNRRSGFTLIEIMLVVIIIGILAGMVFTQFGGMSTDARIARAQADISQLRTQLGLFEQRIGRYPTEEDGGLMALLERPSSIPESQWKAFGETEPIDPWNNPYIYLAGNRRIDQKRAYNLYSMGPNGQDDNMTGDDIPTLNSKREQDAAAK